MTTPAATPITLRTSVAIVGSGPGGAILALLLAKSGVNVTLLEQHSDFNRQFRGDSVHPATLELLDQLGLAEKLLALPHTKSSGIPTRSSKGSFDLLDLSRLPSKFPYFVLIQQSKFIEFVVNEAQRYPNCRVLMGAGVRKLLEENGKVTGVAFQRDGAWTEVHAEVTVAADGRHSMVRKLAGLEPKTTHRSGMDTLWFTVPRAEGDPPGSSNLVSDDGVMLAALQREEYWQIGYNILKGSYPQLKAAGLPALQAKLSKSFPGFAERFNALPDFKGFSLLDVQINRLEQWYRSGLLFIGDAAHSMSPAFGVGINLAVQDAVAAANGLAPALLAFQQRGASVPLDVLEGVQRRREPITKLIQGLQGLAGNRRRDGPPPPIAQWLMTSPLLRQPIARLVGLGWKPERWQGPVRAQGTRGLTSI